MKKILCNNRGSAHISTGVKIIIAVVIGSLILGGLYLLFAGDTGVMTSLPFQRTIPTDTPHFPD